MGGEWPRGAATTEEFSRKFPEKEGVERNFGELRAKKRFREHFFGPAVATSSGARCGQKLPIPTLAMHVFIVHRDWGI